MIKAIFFDMDGVLIDAKDWHYDALNRALMTFGFSISRESHLSTFDGLPTKEKLNILSKVYNFPVALHGFLNDLKQQYTLEITYQHCKPTFNHQNALSSLKKNGFSIAVCSNSIRNTIISMMSLSDLDQYIDLMLSNEDVIRSKPDPEIYLKAAHHFGLNPDECLILEDNENGIKAATESGCHLLKIGTPNDVTLQNIERKINEINLSISEK